MKLKTWNFRPGLVALIATTAVFFYSQTVSTQIISAGGTHSSGCEIGLKDFTKASNHDTFRSKGGELYIHEVGWGSTTDTQRNQIKDFFDPGEVIYETGAAQSLGASKRTKNFWGAGKLRGVTVNFLEDLSNGVEVAQEIKNKYAQWCAPVFSPNANGQSLDWNSSSYNYLKEVALAGGALSTDAPPKFFFERSQEYRDFLYDQLRWCKNNNVLSVVIVSPHNSTNFKADAEKYKKDIVDRGLQPDVWAIQSYGEFSSGCDGSGRNNWIGNEDEQQSTLGVARNVFQDNNNNQGDRIVQFVKRNAPGFAIDGDNNGATDQNVHLWQNNINNVNQQWEELDWGNGYYTYRKHQTNYCLDGGNGGGNDQNVKLWDCDANNQNQHWKKISVGSGYYRLEKRNAQDYSLDGGVGGGNGQNLKLWGSNQANQNQHWDVKTVGYTGSLLKNPEYTKKTITVYPNPATSSVTISMPDNLSEKASYTIFDFIGRTVKKGVIGSKNTQLFISELNRGVYFITVHTGSEIFKYEFIKN